MKLQSRHEKQMGQVCLITDEATWCNKSPSKLQSLMMFQVMVLFQQCYNWIQTADIHKQSHNHLNKNYTIIFNNDSQHSKIQSRAKTQKHEHNPETQFIQGRSKNCHLRAGKLLKLLNPIINHCILTRLCHRLQSLDSLPSLFPQFIKCLSGMGFLWHLLFSLFLALQVRQSHAQPLHSRR